MSKSIDAPSDLKGMYYREYVGFRGFREALTKWLVKVVQVEASRFELRTEGEIDFEDKFDDRDRFMRWWNPPPGCHFFLTSEDLRLSNAYYPLWSTTLGILQDYEFTFRARIEHEAVGWFVKGTIDYRKGFPVFGVMFNVTDRGVLRAHILSEKVAGRKLDYFYNDAKDVATGLDLRDAPFMVTTRCVGDEISVDLDGNRRYTLNFGSDPDFAVYYNYVRRKHGQVGFRCAGWRPETGEWGEAATINWVKLREIEKA